MREWRRKRRTRQFHSRRCQDCWDPEIKLAELGLIANLPWGVTGRHICLFKIQQGQDYTEQRLRQNQRRPRMGDGKEQDVLEKALCVCVACDRLSNQCNIINTVMQPNWNYMSRECKKRMRRKNLSLPVYFRGLLYTKHWKPLSSSVSVPLSFARRLFHPLSSPLWITAG